MPKGSCQCGDLTYEFEGEPLVKALCHCLTCRKLTGSPYSATFMIPDPAASSETPPPNASFRLSSKTNTPLRETKAMHECGIELIFSGCAKCPSTLYKRAPAGFPGVLIVFAGGLDGADEPKNAGLPRETGGMEAWGNPQAELWVKYRLPWVGEVKGAKQCQAFE